MNKEQVIEKAKEQYSEIWDCDINHPKYEDTVEEIVTGVIRLIMQPTSVDCISRKALIERINNAEDNFISDHQEEMNDGDSFCDGIMSAIFNIREMVAQASPVTPTQRWIPVSERLPTENERVLVNQTIDNRNVVYCTRFPFEKTKVEYITAWQPLPKPYEEKRGNEDG